MIRCEMKKYLSSYAFYVAILVVVVLMLAGTIYTMPSNGTKYNVFDMIKKENRKVVIDNGVFSIEDKLLVGTESYLWMFAPIVAAIPFTMLICAERKNSLARFELYRAGKRKYRIGKFFAAMISGGLILLTGYILFSVILSIAMRGQGLEGLEEFGVRASMARGNKLCSIVNSRFGFAGIYILKLISMYLYGMLSAVFAFAISGVLKNRYMILCVPFIVNYFWIMFAEKSTNRIVINLNPSFMDNIFSYDWKVLLIMFMIEVIAAMVIYRICMERRCDCSEN